MVKNGENGCSVNVRLHISKRGVYDTFSLQSVDFSQKSIKCMKMILQKKKKTQNRAADF